MNPAEAVRICERGDTGVIVMAGSAAAKQLHYGFITTSAVTKTGTGTPTVTASGAAFTNANGKDKRFKLVVTTAADTDIFRWSDNGGQTWHENVSVTGSAQTLSDGVTVTFNAITGCVVGDTFEFTVSIPRNIKYVGLTNSVTSNGTYYYGFRSTITADATATAGFPIAEGGLEFFEINDLSKVWVLGGNSKTIHVTCGG